MNPQAVKHFTILKSQIDEVLEGIKKSCEADWPHPSQVNWSHVGTQTELLKKLKEVEEFLK